MKRGHIKSAGSLIFLLFICVALFGQRSTRQKTRSVNEIPVTNKVIDAKDFYNPASPTCGIQEAVDQLKPEGGTLLLSSGVYKIRKSIVLFSGVTIKVD